MKTKAGFGFTLVELLVVIAVIGILVTMLLPTVQRAKALARNVRTGASIANLTLACETYYLDCGGYYPGQRHPEMLTGTLNEDPVYIGPLTGSQLLASLELQCSTLERFEIRNGKLTISSDLATPASLSDQMHEPMPILYYPARLGLSGAEAEDWKDEFGVFQTTWIFNAYIYGDNTAYFTTDRHLDFHAHIREDRLTKIRSRNPGKFSFIAAGMDRQYFTGDDVGN